MPITADARATHGGKSSLEVDGINAGWIMSQEGGSCSADVVSEKLGPDHIVHKHIASPKYEDIKISCGTGMSKGFYTWIQNSFKHNYSRTNGAIVNADSNYKELTRLTWQNALISEIGFPALDGASKDAAKMSLSWTPEITRLTMTMGGGASVYGSKPIDAPKQKMWLPSNFRIKKCEALSYKQKNTRNDVGELRDAQVEPCALEVPNLVITLPESHADEFYKWHEDFVIKGNCGQAQERGGTIEYLTPNLTTVLFTLTLKQLGIFKITTDKNEAHNDAIRTVKVEMYMEDTDFNYSGAAVWA